jgi:hypothetical protein
MHNLYESIPVYLSTSVVLTEHLVVKQQLQALPILDVLIGNRNGF